MYVNDAFPNTQRRSPVGWTFPTPWDDERIAKLKDLWAAGKSASLIAREIGGGFTKNAVIGKAHRLGLEARKTVERKGMHRHPWKPKAERHIEKDLRIFMPPRLRAEPLPPEPARPAKLVAFADLTEKTCRFIYGDPKQADSGYCGCKKVPGSPYCEGHHARMYTAPKPKSRYNPAGQTPAGIPKQIAKYIPSAEDCAEVIA